MPQLFQDLLLDAVTVDGNGDAVDVRNVTLLSVFVEAVGGTSAAVKLEGTADPAGEDGWGDVAFRQGGGGAYGTTAVTVSAGSGVSFYVDPADNINWIRAVVSAQTGPTALTAYVTGEV